MIRAGTASYLSPRLELFTRSPGLLPKMVLFFFSVWSVRTVFFFLYRCRKLRRLSPALAIVSLRRWACVSSVRPSVPCFHRWPAPGVRWPPAVWPEERLSWRRLAFSKSRRPRCLKRRLLRWLTQRRRRRPLSTPPPRRRLRTARPRRRCRRAQRCRRLWIAQWRRRSATSCRTSPHRCRQWSVIWSTLCYVETWAMTTTMVQWKLERMTSRWWRRSLKPRPRSRCHVYSLHLRRSPMSRSVKTRANGLTLR